VAVAVVPQEGTLALSLPGKLETMQRIVAGILVSVRSIDEKDRYRIVDDAVVIGRRIALVLYDPLLDGGSAK